MRERVDAERRGIVFRSRSGIVLTLVAWAICLGIAVSAVLEAEGFAIAIVALTAGWLCFVVLWRPSVTCREDEVVLSNLVREVTVPLALIDDVTTRFSLEVHVDERGVRRSYSAWGAPAPGKGMGMRRVGEHDAHDVPHELRRDGAVRPGDLITTASGGPATVIRRALAARTHAGLANDGALQVTSRVLWPVALTSVALVGASIAAVTLGL